MRVDVVLRYVGVVMIFIALFMLLSAGISYVSGMDSAFYPLLLSSLLTALLGAFPLIFVERTEQITNKEGFCVVVGSWLVACVVGTFPYLIWGGEFSLVNAWFESVSGFTTTGSTILNDVEALPRGLQFWRFSTTWVGGMGVVMFALLILPSLGRNKLTLSNVELSTLAKDNYRYRTQIIVQILLVVYVGLTVVSTLLLKMAGMNWFDSLCHAMSACATSGFSTKNASVAYFNSPMIDTILIFAMATAGIHFGLIYATVTGKRSNIFRSEVTRWYLGMLFAGGLLIAVSLYAADIYPAFTSAFRHGLFQFVSVVTTTGFATADSNQWTSFAVILLIFGSIVCACAGSTAGGIKTNGLVLAGKSDPAFNRERLQLVFNETAADLRTLGIDCAALVDVKRVLPASTVSVLYDCLYDFAAAAFAASNPILMLFVSDKAEAGEGEGSGDGVAAGQHHRVVEMRAALEAGGSSQSKGYTRSLEELRRVLERRNVRFALDIAPDGATLAVQVSEGEGVA